MLDHSTVFLRRARQETRDVDKCKDGNFKRITEPYEARSLAGAIDIQTPRQNHRLIGDHPDSRTLKAHETSDDVFGKVFLNFVEIPFVAQFQDQLFHVVGRIRIVRNERIQAVLNAVHIIEEWTRRRFGPVIEREEIYQAAHFGQCLHIILKRAIGNGGFLGMGGCATQFFSCHDLVRDGFHDVGACDEHV